MKNEGIFTSSTEYNGKEYKTYIITYDDILYVFGTVDLENQLVDDNGVYSSSKAKRLDEQIVYYLSSEEEKDMTYTKLLNYIDIYPEDDKSE